MLLNLVLFSFPENWYVVQSNDRAPRLVESAGSTRSRTGYTMNLRVSFSGKLAEHVLKRIQLCLPSAIARTFAD